ncbi:MAG TPA: hypothetical protein VHB46_10480 [Burkholderiales bacterium]|nr:hypothetical protein [Burkholderiales bacterium]
MHNFTTRLFAILFIAATAAACTNPAVAITNRALDSRDISAYNEYLKDAAMINLEREKAGLDPTPVMTRDEWAGKKP